MDFRRLFSAKGLDRNQRRMLGILIFLVRLFLLSIPLYLIIALGTNMLPLQTIVAEQSAYVLGVSGYRTSIEGTVVSSDAPGSGYTFMFMIDPDCTGWKSMLFLFALILAVPGIMWNRRAVGLAIGLPLLWAVNVIRIVLIVMTETAYNVSTALFVHDVIWQTGLIAVVLGYWAAWLKWARRPKKGKLNLFASLYNFGGRH